MSAPATRTERRHSPIAAPNTAAIGCAGVVASCSNSSSRLPPDQKRSSNPSASRFTLRRLDHFSNTTAQTQTLAASRPSMTIFTTMSASRNSPHSERSAPGVARFSRIDCPIHLLPPVLSGARLFASRRAHFCQNRPPALRQTSRFPFPGLHAGEPHRQHGARPILAHAHPGAASRTRLPPRAARSPRSANSSRRAGRR